jgi:hypothetical protein
VGASGKANGEGEEGVSLMYFAYGYGNRTMRPVEIVPRRRGMRENDGGVKLIKIYCKD